MKNCSNNRSNKRTAIIGAGIASCGFAAAVNPKHNTSDLNSSNLNSSNLNKNDINNCVIFEKARGLGGRMSNFRTETGFIELGAQFITAKQPPFAEFIETCQALNLVQTLKTLPVIGSVQTPAWHAQQRFSSIHKHVLQDFQIHLSTRIIALDLESGFVHAQVTSSSKTDSKNSVQQLSFGPFEQIILTVPAPQAWALIPKNQQSHFQALTQVEYWPCWVFVIKLKHAYPNVEPHPQRFADVLASDSIQWLHFAKNDPIQDKAVVIVQMSHTWSETHKEQTAKDLHSKVFEILDSLQLTPDEILRSHFWRYAKPKHCIHQPFISTPGLGYIGDACLGGRVESAFMSGYAYGLHCQSH